MRYRLLERDESAEPDPNQNMVRAAPAWALRTILARVERHDEAVMLLAARTLQVEPIRCSTFH
jgi:hypothetical protein